MSGCVGSAHGFQPRGRRCYQLAVGRRSHLESLAIARAQFNSVFGGRGRQSQESVILPRREHSSIRFEHDPASVVTQAPPLNFCRCYGLTRERLDRVDIDGRYLHDRRVDGRPPAAGAALFQGPWPWTFHGRRFDVTALQTSASVGHSAPGRRRSSWPWPRTPARATGSETEDRNSRKRERDRTRCAVPMSIQSLPDRHFPQGAPLPGWVLSRWLTPGHLYRSSALCPRWRPPSRLRDRLRAPPPRASRWPRASRIPHLTLG